MMVVRHWSVAAVLLGLASQGGCAALGIGPDGLVGRGQKEPDEVATKDRWGFVGKEGRGMRPLADEHDPLKPYLMSKEAQDIEHNLGYK